MVWISRFSRLISSWEDIEIKQCFLPSSGIGICVSLRYSWYNKKGVSPLNRRFVFAILIVCTALLLLVYTAVVDTAKAVATVGELTKQGVIQNNIRLGARVTEDKIDYQTTPQFLVRFAVRDITDNSSKRIRVVYYGSMPDNLKEGRDVIMEGDFSRDEFVAKNLMTQCPSKYKPPIPRTN